MAYIVRNGVIHYVPKGAKVETPAPAVVVENKPKKKTNKSKRK